jgi:hypothetical protein
MAKPGTQFSGDGISLSWPRKRDGSPGIREVREIPPGRRSGRVRRMILEGSIAEVDLPVTEELEPEVKPVRLFAGGSREALRRMREPAGPVIRQVFVPVGTVESVPTETSVLEDEPDRRPGPPEFPEEDVRTEPPEPTFDERVSQKADSATLRELQKEARGEGITKDDLPGEGWGDKLALASAILTRQIASEEQSETSEEE